MQMAVEVIVVDVGIVFTETDDNMTDTIQILIMDTIEHTHILSLFRTLINLANNPMFHDLVHNARYVEKLIILLFNASNASTLLSQ